MNPPSDDMDTAGPAAASAMGTESVDVVDGPEEELSFVSYGGDEKDTRFDEIVGALEEILMEEDFRMRQTRFMQRYCNMFEDTEENKLEYMDVFRKYIEGVEKHLERRLAERVLNFSMEEFSSLLESREDQISSDLQELLLSFADFATFKEMMLSQKREMQDTTGMGLGLSISGTRISRAR